MEDAIWNIPEHIGWQIIHAHEQSNGNPRKFSNRIKCDNTFDSFRNIIVPEDQETDTLNDVISYGLVSYGNRLYGV